MDGCCEMKGFLSFLMLWMISKKEMTGADISREIGNRKSSRPSPGTIYPALKELKKKGLITSGKDKSYRLTKKGKKELTISLKSFFNTFCDIEEMRCKCGK